MLRQRTIQKVISTKGVGLHSGRRVEITLRPAAPNTGIVFHRVDLPEVVDLPAQADQVGNTRMASVLQQGNVRVSTRSEEHTSELQSLMRTSYAVFCLKKK